MNRRNFIENLTLGSGVLATASLVYAPATGQPVKKEVVNGKTILTADVVIAGGGLGGCASAMAALRNDLSVILTEETDWIGGQLSQQGVPPDEHPWIETHGATQL